MDNVKSMHSMVSWRHALKCIWDYDDDNDAAAADDDDNDENNNNTDGDGENKITYKLWNTICKSTFT